MSRFHSTNFNHFAMHIALNKRNGTERTIDMWLWRWPHGFLSPIFFILFLWMSVKQTILFLIYKCFTCILWEKINNFSSFFEFSLRITAKIDDDMLSYYCNEDIFLLEVRQLEEDLFDITLTELPDHAVAK